MDANSADIMAVYKRLADKKAVIDSLNRAMATLRYPIPDLCTAEMTTFLKETN